MKKTNAIISLIFNALILLTEGFALTYTYFDVDPQSALTPLQNFFCHYTADSNLLLFLAAFISFFFGIICLIKKKDMPLWVAILKLASVVSVVTTMLVVACLLVPMMGWENGKMMIIGKDFIFLHFIDPLLALIAFVGFEIEPKIKKRLSFLCLAPLVVYAAAMAPLCSLTSFPDPYEQAGLLNLANAEPFQVTWKWCAIFFGTWLIGFLILWGRQGVATLENKREEQAPSGNVFIEDRGPQVTPPQCGAADDAVVIQDDEGSEESEEAKEIKDEEEEKKINPTGYMNRPRVYHIARQAETSKWQVRLATGQKAIKLFDTQEQAIQYAKSLVKTQGGSIRVHSLKGKMRKE